jgi:Uma2 family endonuclease
MGAFPVTKLSVEEYLALDRAAEVPSEYHDGELFPIEAVSRQHAMIAARLSASFVSFAQKTSCHVGISPFPVRVSPTKFVIPDLVLWCGNAILTDDYQDTLTNPKVIVEVLSPSTEGYDLGRKFELYQLLDSFEEYLLVSQDKPRVQVFRKTRDRRWTLSIYEGLGDIAVVESLSMQLPLNEIYGGIDLSV